MMSNQKVAYFEVSPVYKKTQKQIKEEEKEDIPLLRLIQFTHSPKLSFNTVKLGTTQEKKLYVLNPKDQQQELFCEKYPLEENGFTISPMRSVINPGQTTEIILTWTPQDEGNIRELIHWKTSLGIRSQTVLLGTCVDPRPKKKNVRKTYKTNPLKQPVKQPLKPHNSQPSMTKQKQDSSVRPRSRDGRAPIAKAQKRPSKLTARDIENVPPTQQADGTARGPLFKVQEGRKDVNVPVKSDIHMKNRNTNRNLKERNYVTFDQNVYVEECTKIYEEDRTDVFVEEYIDYCDIGSLENQSEPFKNTYRAEELVSEFHSEVIRTDERPLTYERNSHESHKMTRSKEKFSADVIPPSPARRQTYIKSSSTDSEEIDPNLITERVTERFSMTSSFTTHSQPLSLADLKDDPSTLDPTSERTRPHSRKSRSRKRASKNEVPAENEMFGDARRGLLSCDVVESPLRRQTYVKRSCDGTEGMKTIDEQLESENQLDLTISTPSSFALSPDSGVKYKPASSMTPSTPGLTIRNQNQEIRESCRNLLDRLDCMFDSPQPPNASSFEGTRSLPLRTQGLTPTAKNIRAHSSAPQSLDMVEEVQVSSAYAQSEVSTVESMHTAPCSPVDFVTAPTTPAECPEDFTLIDNLNQGTDCNVTQDFPTPKIYSYKSVDLGNLSALLAAQGLIDSDKTKSMSDTLSPDSLEKSDRSNVEDVFPNISEEIRPEDEVEFYPHQRLSNGTVVLEASILHPDDIISIDESPQRNTEQPETNGDIFVSPLPIRQKRIDSDEKEPDLKGCSVTPQTSTVYTPVTQSFGSCRSISSDAALATPDLFLTRNEMLPPPHSVTIASLADFSFLPGDDPKRCSTIIKSPRPVQKTVSEMNNKESSIRKTLFCENIYQTDQVKATAQVGDGSLVEPITQETDEQSHSQTYIKRDLEKDAVATCQTFIKKKDLSLTSQQPEVEDLDTNNFGATLPITDQPLSCTAPVQAPPVESGTHGLVFIEISPPSKAVPSTRIKRSSVKPKPAVKMSVTSRKISQQKPLKKMSGVNVTSKVRKPPSRLNLVRESKLTKAQPTLNLTTSQKNEDGKDGNTNSLSSSGDNHIASITQTISKSSSSSSSSVGPSTKDVALPKLRRSRQFLSQSRLMLTKGPRLTSQVHHPNPYAARNMYYDDRWTEKQISGFTKWLNFVLTPPEEDHLVDRKGRVSGKECAMCYAVDVTKLWMEANRCSSMQKAPSREAMSLKTYTARRQLGKLRRSACRLYQSAEMAKVITKLEVAVDKKLITIRKDRQTHADMGLKQEMLKLTLCFNPLWLRIGLETVYGEVIFLNSNSDIAGLSLFIITRLLTCPDIARRYAHPTVPFSYKAGFEESLKTFQLRRFLMLVYFLDKAKEARLIDHDPCLFNKESGFKTTRDILLAFAREFLSGVGDFTKHLAYLGYAVTHQQTPLDEFDYAVSNLATDLRCGIRLTRVAETLLQDYTLSSHLRMPSVSRLQKIHNVDVALKALQEAGSLDHEGNYTSKDIVDGHREKTLALLWDIIFNLQIKNILSVSRLVEEIYHLRKTLIVKGSTGKACNRKGILNAKSLSKEIVELDNSSHSSELILQLLKLWARLICAHYDLEVDNFTVSFCDGRAFSFILHHYHPELLKLDHIKQNTTQNLPSPTRNLDESTDDSFSGESYYDNEEIERRLLNDKSNFNLFISKLNELGGVPVLIRSSDMINTIPDEKVTTTFLAYFCARLLDLSAEIKAARVIQLAWRERLAQIKLERIKRETNAALVIQSWWRERLLKKYAAMYTKATLTIQSHWRRVKAQRQLLKLRQEKELLKQNKAALIIQSYVRRFLSRRQRLYTIAAIKIQRNWRKVVQRQQFLKVLAAALKIQSTFRSWTAQKKYNTKRNAAKRVQKWWRLKMLEKKTAQELQLKIRRVSMIQNWWKTHLERRTFLKIRQATVILQSQFRRVQQQKIFWGKRNAVVTLQRKWRATLMMRKQREEFLKQRKASLVIQSWIRSCWAREKYKKQKLASIKIQTWFRKLMMQNRYRRVKKAAIVLQQCFRCYLLLRTTREEQIKKHKAAVNIQKNVLMILARKEFIKKRNAALVIQKNVRMTLVRTKYMKKKMAATSIQKNVRMSLARKEYVKKKNAAIIIQKNIRMIVSRNAYIKKRNAAVVIQKNVRMILAKAEHVEKKKAAISIQRNVRMILARKEYVKKKNAAIIIQKNIRMIIARKAYIKKRNAAVVIQKNVRMILAKAEHVEKKKAAISIQRNVRMILARKEYVKKKNAAIIIQKNIRMIVAKNAYIKKRNAAVVIQKNLRMILAKAEHVEKKKAAISIQRNVRMILARKEYVKKKNAAIIIQKNMRMIVAKNAYIKKRNAAVVIQKNLRMILAKAEHVEKKKAAISIQRNVRMILARKEYVKKKNAAIIIQKNIRMIVAKNAYIKKRNAAVVIQKNVRMILAKAEHVEKKKAAISIQRNVRMILARKEYVKKKNAAIIIQKNIRMIVAKNAYIKKRNAAVVIQKNVRMILAKAEHVEKKKAAISIQRNVRMILARKEYVKKKNAAIIIQKNMRMIVAKNAYIKKRNAAVVIQKNLRMILAKAEHVEKKKAAISIQRNVRMILARKEYVKKKNAAIIIQKNMRMIVAKNAYIKKRNAAVVIQKNLRMILAKAEHVEKKNAAISIQRNVRMILARKEYVKKKNAAIIIQKNMRMIVARNAFIEKRNAAVVIQKNVRMILARREHIEKKMAAISIQRNIRMILARKEYVKKKNAAIIIQKNMRMIVAKNAYIKKRNAAVVIQKNLRMILAKAEHVEKKKAAISIQRNVRMILARKEYVKKKNAAIIIQKNIRMIVAKNAYIKKRNAAVVIQKNVRMILARTEHIEKKMAAISIQSNVRMILARKEYVKKRTAAIIIQKNIRMIVPRKSYIKKLNAAVIIQKNVRMILAKAEHIEKKMAAISIQKNVRMILAQKEYIEMKNAAIIIQKNIRMIIARKTYIKKRNAAVVIQKNVRMILTRTEHIEKKNAAISIQKNVRMILARKEYVKKKNAAIIIQKNIRMNLCKKEFIAKRNAALVFQKNLRMFHGRKEYITMRNAAITIQKNIRMILARKEYLKKRNAAVIIQKNVRMFISMNEYIEKKKAAVVIQKKVRMILARKEYIKNLREAAVIIEKNVVMIKAVKTIQMRWRAVVEMRKQQELYRIKRGAAICIQSVWRGMKARREMKHFCESAIKIQATYKGWIQRRQFVVQKTSTLLIQRWWRECLQMKQLQRQYDTQRRAAVIIQRNTRLWLEKKTKAHQREAAALTLQTYWRKHRTQTKFIETRRKIVLIQKWWRSHLELKKIRCNYLYLQGCIILIQARGRGLLARKMYRHMKQERENLLKTEEAAAISIQSCWRSYRSRREYKRKRDAVVQLQRYWRGALKMLMAREYFIYLQRATIILQAAWRGRVVRKQYRRIQAAVTIQRAFREWSLKKTQAKEERKFVVKQFIENAQKNLAVIRIQRWFRRHRYFTRRIESITTIQRSVRTYVQRKRFLRVCQSVRVIQRTWRQVRESKRQERLNRMATVIQRHWRGYLTRKKLRSNRRITMIQGRLLEANAQACEANMIGHKTGVAVKTLGLIKFQVFRNLQMTLFTMMNLDTCSRLSPICCEKVCSDEVISILIFILKSSNRSLPHMHIMTYVLNTLITMGKFDKFLSKVHTFPELIPSVVNLMKIYHVKGPAIFLKSCTLLYLLTSSSQVPKSMLSTPRTLEDLSSICNLLKRKFGHELKGKAEILPSHKCPSTTQEWAMKPMEIREFSNALYSALTLKQKLQSIGHQETLPPTTF